MRTRPRSGSRRAQEREVRRRLILEAAARVFAESGYHRATMAEIARAAEISLGGLYALFPGKAHLYGDLVSLKQGEILDLLRDDLALRSRGRRRLSGAERRALVCSAAETIMRYFEGNEPFFRIYVNESAALGWNIRASLGDQAFRLYEEVVQVMAAAIGAGRRGRAAGAQARVKALSIVGVINALITEWVSHKKKGRDLSSYLPPLRAIVERIVD